MITGLILIAVAALVIAEAPMLGAHTLRVAAGRRVLIGTAAMAPDLSRSDFSQIVASQFNCLTAGNEMKPDYLQHVQGTFTFQTADRIIKFAQANHLEVIGHTLCWHQQTPKWMFEDEAGQPLPRDKALANLREHIRGVLTHFKGQIKGWDVVNEAINDSADADLRNTPALRAIGDDYVLKAFEYAHEADPNVELYYNDYNIELDYKRDRALRLIRKIKASGLRLDGVGIQGHWLLESPPVVEIERGLKAFSDEGINIVISEMDVDVLPRDRSGPGADLNATEEHGQDPYKQGLPDSVQAELAKRYGELFATLLKYPRVTRITLWGVTDADTWLNDFPVHGRTNYPMLWDRKLQPKQAFQSVFQALEVASKGAAATTKPR